MKREAFCEFLSVSGFGGGGEEDSSFQGETDGHPGGKKKLGGAGGTMSQMKPVMSNNFLTGLRVQQGQAPLSGCNNSRNPNLSGSSLRHIIQYMFLFLIARIQ